MLKSRFEINLEQVYLSAKNDRVEDQLEDELASFAELLRQHYDFKLFLEDPRISAKEKKKYIKKMCPEGITGNFTAVVYMLIDHGREELIGALSKDFTRELAGEKKITFGQVSSVCRLPAKIKKKIEQVVGEWRGGQIKLRYDIDPDLLGGLRLNFIDGNVWDLSLRYRLNAFKEAILA